jgi:hypothetical protein
MASNISSGGTRACGSKNLSWMLPPEIRSTLSCRLTPSEPSCTSLLGKALPIFHLTRLSCAAADPQNATDQEGGGGGFQ